MSQYFLKRNVTLWILDIKKQNADSILLATRFLHCQARKPRGMSDLHIMLTDTQKQRKTLEHQEDRLLHENEIIPLY